MALGSAQAVVKMNTRNIPGDKGGRLTTLPPSRAECHAIWEPKPPGTLRATPGLLRDSFTFYIGREVKDLLFVSEFEANLNFLDTF
jgi:hypothetical protein